MAASTVSAFAGGLLTNTNQNVVFLRNPARDAAIGIDGVYSNPAGVAFLKEGLHLSLNVQSAYQTREITTTHPLFAIGMQNNGMTTKEFEGEAKAPVIPSLQAAYNKGKWSFQFGFAVTGGGGKCEFDNGLGSFEGKVGEIAAGLKSFGATGYDADIYMQGKQYYFGFTLGAAYKVNDNLSVYGGARVLYGTASYKAKIQNIMVNTGNDAVPFAKFHEGAVAAVPGLLAQVNAGIDQVNAGIEQYEAAGVPVPQDLIDNKARLEGNKAALETAPAQLATLEQYKQGLNVLSDQEAWGIAPIVGVDYKMGKLNLAAKYEFKTRMRMKNNSNVKTTSLISEVNKFVDGTSVAEDSPALLTVGAQYSILPSLRVSAGWHHYFDVDTKQYTKEMLDDTNEYLFGMEYDINDKVQVSLGGQRTEYAIKDKGMSDMSFNVSSFALGCGVGVNVTENLKLNAAYFHTFYDDYDMMSNISGMEVKNNFTRTNFVFGVGADLTF